MKQQKILRQNYVINQMIHHWKILKMENQMYLINHVILNQNKKQKNQQKDRDKNPWNHLQKY